MRTAFFTATLAAALLAGCARQEPDLRVADAWARPTVAGQAGAVYLTIANRGGSDRLRAVATPAAASASLHQSSAVDGMMRMRPLPDGLPIEAGGTAMLAPGGTHIMLEGLARPLAPGDRIDLRLTFDRSPEARVAVAVRGAAGMTH